MRLPSQLATFAITTQHVFVIATQHAIAITTHHLCYHYPIASAAFAYRRQMKLGQATFGEIPDNYVPPRWSNGQVAIYSLALTYSLSHTHSLTHSLTRTPNLIHYLL